MKILILCTGNSCRSQLAEFYLKSLDPNLEVHSAGTNPAQAIHPMALELLREAEISHVGGKAKNLDSFLTQSFDFVITVCGAAEENCPSFTGQVKQRLHLGFDDPAALEGSGKEIKRGFLRIFKEIQEVFDDFYQDLEKQKQA